MKSLVNMHDMHTPFLAYNRTIPTGQHTLPPPPNSVDAVAGKFNLKGTYGGAFNLKNKLKIKNLLQKYKQMYFKSKSRKHSSKRIRTKHRKHNKSRRTLRSHRTKKYRKTRHRGGHSQYGNNRPVDISFGIGKSLPPSLSSLANPAPIGKVSNNAIDNYNHNKLNSFGNPGGAGFPSKGWF